MNVGEIAYIMNVVGSGNLMWSWGDEGALAKGAYLASLRYVKSEVRRRTVGCIGGIVLKSGTPHPLAIAEAKPSGES